MNSLVTIGIPSYKRLNYLKEAVTSALMQSYSNIEIIISQDPDQDGPNKSIQTWGQALSKEHIKIRYQCNSKNLGLAGNWNAIADSAKGEFLIIIGDDDRLLPNFVENLMKVIQSNTTVAFCNHYLINTQGERLERQTYEFTKQYKRDKIPAGKLNTPEICVWQNSIPMSAALIKTKEVQKLRFKEDLNTPEIELFIRLAQAGHNFVFLPEYLSEYRIHPQAATATGLRIEKLVDYLLSIPVSSQIEPYKKEMLARLMINATSRYLLQGNVKQARKLLESEYYPLNQRSIFKALLQKFSTNLPWFLGCSLYRFIHSIKQQF